MIRSIIVIAAAGLAFASSASAAVIGKLPYGFEVRHEAIVALPPAKAWSRLIAIGTWWSDEHTFGGKAANMTIDPKAGGCFCEVLPESNGGVEHLRVTYVVPNQRLVMGGALGPLKFEGVAGVMDIRLNPASEGKTQVIFVYRAGGFARGNGEDMAPLVDRVIGEQVARFAAPPATP